MEKKFELKGPAAFGCLLVALAIGLAAGALFLSPGEEPDQHICPTDYWPHLAQTNPPPPTPPEPCPPMLMTILTEAAKAYDAAPAADKPLILDCITLTLDCAWQDLTAHTPTQQSDHAEAVRLARDAAIGASPTKWADVKKFMTPASPIPGETIDHPH